MLYELFIEPWTIGDWMWRGVLVSSLVAISCAILGTFLYLKRLSLLADAMAHVALPGIVAAYLLTGSQSTPTMLLGAILAGLVTSGLIRFVERYGHARTDAAIGIVFTSLFALGILLLSTFARDAHLDLNCVLYGNVLGVADHSLILLAVVTVAIVALTVLFFRPLQLATFDPALAAAFGLPVGLIHAGLMGTLSVTTVASFEAVGAILVIAAIITPAATAHLIAKRLETMLLVAVAHGLLSAVLGMYLSIWLECSSAGAMVTTGALLYAVTLGATWARRRWRRAQRRQRLQASALPG
ncbi:MAG: iron ABC transporter [Myxococcales bacterium]|nr:iron ABC transporter [Myxococcales bacterium]